MIGIPLSWRVIHDGCNGKAAIAVKDTNASISCIETSSNLAAAEIWLRGERLIVISVYFGAEDRIEERLSDVDSILTRFNGAKIVLGGDFNAWHFLWGHPERNNARGETVAEFFCDKDLALLNDPGSPPTFVGLKGCSWIDLTTTSRAAQPLIGGWSVRENTASDHNYISFFLDSKAVPSTH